MVDDGVTQTPPDGDQWQSGHESSLPAPPVGAFRPDLPPVPPAPEDTGDDSGFVTSRHTGGTASFARFVPDSTELQQRTASLKPASTGVLDRDHAAGAAGAYAWAATSEEQLEAAGRSDEDPATGSATPHAKTSYGRVAAVALAIVVAVAALLFVTGSFSVGGPQQTVQSPVTTTTRATEVTPLAPESSIVQSGALAQGGLGTYPATTPEEAMVAVLGAVQGQDAQLLRTVTAPTADLPAVKDIVTQLNDRSATIDSTRNSVTCTTNGATATCDLPTVGLGRTIAFTQTSAGWSLTGWGA